MKRNMLENHPQIEKQKRITTCFLPKWNYISFSKTKLSQSKNRGFGLSRSATPATRNKATRHWKPPKVTTFAELAVGTAIRASRDRPRMVADGCDRKRNVERTHPQPPERVKREPLLRIRENWHLLCILHIWIKLSMDFPTSSHPI